MDSSQSVNTQLPKIYHSGIQTNKDDSQVTNPAIFDQCDVTTIKVKLDTNEYPEVDYELSFPDNRYGRAYRDASMFNKIVHGIDDL